MILRACLLVLLIFNIGCATTYKMSDYDLDSYYRHGEYEIIIPVLQKRVAEDTKDKLIWQLNLALAYQSQGNYKQSNEEFFKIKNSLNWDKVFSLKESALAFALNDNCKKYQVAEYEQLLIQMYVALNFCFMNDYKSALVEVRSLDNAIYHLKQISSDFSFIDKTHLSYFSGLVYEANYKYDEAFIDYERAYQANPTTPYIGFDLYRTATWSGRTQFAQQIAKEYRISPAYQKAVINKHVSNIGELIVIYQNGMAPYKVEHKYRGNVAVYQSRLSLSEEAKISVNGDDSGQTYTVLNIEQLAMNFQKAQIETLFRKDMAQSIVKEVGGWIVGAGGGFVGIVAARTIAQSTSSSDLRTWFFLPKEIQIARINLPKGTQSVDIQYNQVDGLNKNVKIKPNNKTTISVKYGNKL